ncbi:MAG: Do family serine endopeptidase [Candidatus Eisenbacteria bacterium]|nr:Do family serine endopeptidase [Candidatus Eisenbacteria bacterium]
MSPESFNRPRGYYVRAAVLVLAGLVIGLGISAGLNLQRTSNAQKHVTPDAMLESPFVPVVEKALPAVVFIDVKKKVASGPSDPQEEFFRRFFGPGDTPHRPQFRPTSGSGFIIDAAGHILTNNHVVSDAQDITVTLNDKRTFKARVIGADRETDVAVIQVSGDNLPYLPLGDSDRLRIGDWAIAIGNPLGDLRGSVTVGIVSAQGRSNLNIYGGTPAYQDFIQTDASINFGNSGGPLCNIRGEAIGINTAINPSGQGIGFAIPINLAKHVADQLLSGGTVKRAWMGVTLAELTPELAEGLGLDGRQGVLVQSVLKGQPAERAGIRRNDVIVEFNGDAVTDMQKFRIKVADMPIGSRANLVVLREGKRVPVIMTLGPKPPEEQIAQGAPAEPDAEEAPGGLKVRDLGAEEKANSGVESGVMVTGVADGSAAEDAGLQVGDVIEEVNTRPVTSAAALRKTLKDAKAAKKKNAVLLVNTNGQTRFVPLRLE